jgi:hypothetical protein
MSYAVKSYCCDAWANRGVGHSAFLYQHVSTPFANSSGKVCLSLLGTWSGGKGEGWNPTASTALQVRPADDDNSVFM